MPITVEQINAELIKLRDERRALDTQLKNTQACIRALYRKRQDLLRQQAMQHGGVNIPEDQPTIAELELFV
jgi:hypothetical protein